MIIGRHDLFQVFFYLSVIKTRLNFAFLLGNWLITVIFILRRQARNHCSEKPYNITIDQFFITLDAFSLPQSFHLQFELKKTKQQKSTQAVSDWKAITQISTQRNSRQSIYHFFLYLAIFSHCWIAFETCKIWLCETWWMSGFGHFCVEFYRLFREQRVCRGRSTWHLLIFCKGTYSWNLAWKPWQQYFYCFLQLTQFREGLAPNKGGISHFKRHTVDLHLQMSAQVSCEPTCEADYCVSYSIHQVGGILQKCNEVFNPAGWITHLSAH